MIKDRRQIVVIGAGGHAKVVLEVLRAANTFEVIGLTDPSEDLQEVLGASVIGSDKVLVSGRGPSSRFESVEAADRT